ncbi:MAG: NFACT family protein [Gomphosphaeria aponina SAG 52.96 = DSM 107014]|uniref:Rqc2 homolog RqcH n=1 Tax=Gomphosphaeria aponina SAG 52.96 = DSM 107014 TaxID=1521640 RepID=A0A941GWV2_9CHRO|nr:NFACT family protein [Gomphosphaeria aponina SAG 52.96 = DSM 107014]
MQQVDYTTLRAIVGELQSHWLPARVEQVYQRDRLTISLALRTQTRRGWLTISWHPQGARICLDAPPPRIRDTFTFSDQLRHQLGGYALTSIETTTPWERVLDFQFAKRPAETPLWHLYVEIMGKYSNVILTDADHQIVTVAHQVTESQSSFRTLLTGQLYELPPPLTNSTPSLQESFHSWQQRVSLIGAGIKSQLLNSYRGLSPTLVASMVVAANLDSAQSTVTLSDSDWQRLFYFWQLWLLALDDGKFTPGLTMTGYTVLGWGLTQATENVHSLINSYYTNQLNQQSFTQLRHQLLQKIASLLNKLRLKANTFTHRLQQADGADTYREQADLLMAYLCEWQPGMHSITLADFASDQPVTIRLNPEKNGVQNAQFLYKQHQKLKRARNAVVPLLEEVNSEIQYLEQVEASLSQLDVYSSPEDLQTLNEIRSELIQQQYLTAQQYRSENNTSDSQPLRYFSPSGFELWIGRNNRQNDQLTFRTAGDYDLWFHTQEIPGSHVLLRLNPGSLPDDADLQFAADLAGYYSRGRESDLVPVVYTQPKFVYKPKGAKPGIAIYKQERIIWGNPQKAKSYLKCND